MAEQRAPIARVLFRPADESHRVTTLELLFDLVFVFAFTQVTQLLADDPTGVGVLRGIVLLALLWWAWCSYAWLGNQAHADEGVVRATLIVAMAAMFVVALSIPEAFADREGGLKAPLVLAACYLVVRIAHLSCYWVAAGDDAGLHRQLLMTAVPVMTAGGLLVAGGAIGPPAQTLLWAGGAPRRLRRHLADRHVGLAAEQRRALRGAARADRHHRHRRVDRRHRRGGRGRTALLAGAGRGDAWHHDRRLLCGGCTSTSSRPSPSKCSSVPRESERSRLARDSYTYLHFPIVASIVFIALGLKKVLEYVADDDHHELSDAMTGVPLAALFGGVAVYLAGHVGFRRRNVGSWNPHRLTAIVVVLVLLPVAWQLPALVSLGLVAGVLVGLVAYETVRFRQARDAVRHGG